MHAPRYVPRVTVSHRNDLQYMEDYRRAYNEAWMLAWLSACRDDTLHGPEVALRSSSIARAIAADFADLQYQLRH